MNEHTSNALGQFLRARRERLTPEEVGLPSYGRRRTPGLRREEVAQLAHIGTSWYIALEQGREVHPSEQVLDSLANALRLSAEERRHLHQLVRMDHPNYEEADQELSVGLERTVRALEPNPAFVMGRSWDLLMWNRAAELVFRLPAYDRELIEKPNWLTRFLTESALREHNADWEAKAQVLIGRFRTDYGSFPHDVRMKELVEQWIETSELFRQVWPRHDVQAIDDCHKRWEDPTIGKMEFEQVTLRPSNQPGLKLQIYTASPLTAERLKGMLEGN